jgi:hypothetical protein
MDVVTTTAQVAALEHEITFAETEVSRLEGHGRGDRRQPRPSPR